MTVARFTYTLCGWRTLSDISLTRLSQTKISDGAVDVRICLERGEPSITNIDRHFLEHTVCRSLINVANVATYEVIRGAKISVWPRRDATPKDVEIFLLGPAWAALCHQRGVLPLHASAVATKDGIIGFAGNSGAGKSTIAAQLSASGYELVSDDILPVSVGPNLQPGAWPYLRRLKLQGDTISMLSLAPSELVSEKLDDRKWFVLPDSAAADRWRALARIYVLEATGSTSQMLIERLHGMEAISALVNHTYHFEFVRGTKAFASHLALCGRVASQVPIFRIDDTRYGDIRQPLRAMAIKAHLGSS